MLVFTNPIQSPCFRRSFTHTEQFMRLSFAYALYVPHRSVSVEPWGVRLQLPMPPVAGRVVEAAGAQDELGEESVREHEAHHAPGAGTAGGLEAGIAAGIAAGVGGGGGLAGVGVATGMAAGLGTSSGIAEGATARPVDGGAAGARACGGVARARACGKVAAVWAMQEDNQLVTLAAVPHNCSQVYAFTVKGSAFLWHQVRGPALPYFHALSCTFMHYRAPPCAPMHSHAPPCTLTAAHTQVGPKMLECFLCWNASYARSCSTQLCVLLGCYTLFHSIA